jgi:hypothetical protein
MPEQPCPWERIFPVEILVGDDPTERMKNAEAQALTYLGLLVGEDMLEAPSTIHFRPERTDLSIVLVARGEKA